MDNIRPLKNDPTCLDHVFVAGNKKKAEKKFEYVRGA